MIQLYEEPKIKIIDSEVTGNPKPAPEGKLAVVQRYLANKDYMGRKV